MAVKYFGKALQFKALSPYDDDSVAEMQQDFDGAPISEQVIEFPWHQVEEALTIKEMAIEPNETEQMTYDFIIQSEIGAIVVSAWVANASEPKHAEGWYRRAVHMS